MVDNAVCSELSKATDVTHTFLFESATGLVISCLALTSTSLVLLVFGDRTVRCVSAIVVGVVASWSVFVATSLVHPPLACEMRLAIAGTSALLAAGVALCIFKTGIILLGALGVSVLAHTIYVSTPFAMDSLPATSIFGRAPSYYIVLTVATISGAAMAKIWRLHFVNVASSMLGGAGLVLCVHLVSTRVQEKVPAIIMFAILVVSTACGVATQRYLRRRRRNRVRVRRTSSRDAEDARL